MRGVWQYRPHPPHRGLAVQQPRMGTDGDIMTTWIDQQPQDKVEAWIEKHGEVTCAKYYTDNPRFALWMALLDRHVGMRIGLRALDLDDWNYADAYEGGDSPKEAALYMLEDNGFLVVD